MVRYSKIFGHSKVAPFIEEKIGISPKKLYTIGAGLWSLYTRMLGMYYPLENLSVKGINRDDYDKFIGHFSKPLEEIKQILKSERPLDENFTYSYHSLFAYPLIFTEINSKPAYICPLPTLLYWRITSGIYYDLYNMKGFDNVFGVAFEDYVGSVLDVTLGSDTSVLIKAGEPNSKNSPNRCDWVVEVEKDVLIIECKTKRLTMGAKTRLTDDEMYEQLSIIADAVKQAYLSLNAYTNKLYKNPLYELPESKRAYLCVTTLEKWYLMGDQLDMLNELVKEKILAAGLDEDILEKSPYVVLPVDDLEKIIYLAKDHSFNELLQEYIDDPEYRRWEFANYLNKQFKEELKTYDYPFDSEIENIFTTKVDTSKRLKNIDSAQ